MKHYIALIALVISSLAGISFANEENSALTAPPETVFKYEGTGQVVDSSNGEKSDYKTSLMIVVDPVTGKKTYTTIVQYETDVHVYKSVTTSGQHGTYTVDDIDGKNLGTGYCVKEKGCHICHMDLMVNDVPVEQTINFGGGHIERMGSLKGKDGRIFWIDKMTKAK